jgi:hypothetical protein
MNPKEIVVNEGWFYPKEKVANEGWVLPKRNSC